MPVITAVYTSLRTGLAAHLTFNGLANYETILGSEFWKSTQTTLCVAVGTGLVTLAIAWVLAYLMFHDVQARGLFRIIRVYALHHFHGGVGAPFGLGDTTRRPGS